MDGFPCRSGLSRVGRHWFGRVAIPALCLLGASFPAAAEEPIGLAVPEGFEVSLFADDDLAHDIYSLTIDSFGRVVVSGPGYVRILVDADGNGKAETFKQYADGPKTGAEGMYFYGRDLLCSGDGGLIRYRDRNGDDRTDGPPDMFLRIKAGGEHDLHAIRKGPDGWWYLIAGNMAGVTEKYATLPTSPVQKPHGGAILRLKPDLTGGEIVADGLRNAYDYDFNTVGDLFTFDSDGERDMSLPWYLPTRVFHVLPGSNAGWVTESWKHLDDYMDMPPVVGSYGRGSPTGIVCYRHTQFPEPYRGALLALDWTYGRVFAFPLKRNAGTWSTTPIELVTAQGQNGFAPTDADVAPDGSLYIAVGGRGTRGSVYRVRSTLGPATGLPVVTGVLTPSQKLTACLRAPQPLSSWSRRQWEPLADAIGSEPFIRSAMDEERPASERVRAIEILTEKFRGLDVDMAEWLIRSKAAEVRARAAWSLGRTQTESPNTELLAHAVDDNDPAVARCALEALLGAQTETFHTLVEPIGRQLGRDDRYVRQAAVRLLPRVSDDTYHAISAAAVKAGWPAAVPVAQGFALRKPGFNAYALDIGVRVLEGRHPTALKYDAARLVQIALGELAPAEVPGGPVFEGYASRLDLSEHAAELAPIALRLGAKYPNGEAPVDRELARILAMLQPEDSTLIDRVLAAITPASHPTDDVHQLIVLARLPGERTEEQRAATAAALLGIELKIEARKLRQDNSWNDRMMELYTALTERDARLPVALLERPEFGAPGHVLFVASLPPEKFGDAIDVFVNRIKSDADYRWNQDVVLILGASSDPEVRAMLRARFDDWALRGAILMTLAQEPKESDRDLFVQGLDGTPLDVLAECVKALALLDPAQATPVELVTLVRALRRLGSQDQERELRDQIVELLRIRTNEDFGYVLGQNGEAQEEAIQKWTVWAQTTHTQVFAEQSGGSPESLEQLQTLLSQVDWNQGDAARGEKLFQTRQCAQCHNSRQALGPDLAGVAGRFSRDDLFTAIVLPNRDVSPRYQTTTVVTTEGKIYSGLVVYDTVDGVVLRNATNQTIRVEAEEIETRKTVSTSLMPTGLLKDLAPQDLADLYAYLRGMNLQTAAAEQAGGK
jgi:putative membrane-bound dehydrogenase-like protein